jgi:hypothetical protein
MMIIEPMQTVHMDGDPGRLRETLQAVRDHLAGEVSDLLALQA